eukprot:Hpha_TRINITY_DN15343_c2_g12::TRINITY_DN15343_c2_g12_i1::g.88350::m.88350
MNSSPIMKQVMPLVLFLVVAAAAPLPFPPTWSSHVKADLDHGKLVFEYDAIALDSVNYLGNNITKPSPNVGISFLSNVTSNETYVIGNAHHPQETCTTYFFDGIPFDGSAFDGLLWLVQEGDFRLSAGRNEAPNGTEAWVLQRAVYPNGLSAYYEATLYLEHGGGVLRGLEVVGLGVDKKNHTLREEYHMRLSPPPLPAAFAPPSNCGACVNCAK